MAETRSGVRFHFKVQMDDGKNLDIQSIPFDSIRYERKYERKFSDGQGSAEMLLWIAYAAGSRMKLITESTFDKWVEHVDELILVDDDEDQPAPPDPTPDDSPMEESLS